LEKSWAKLFGDYKTIEAGLQSEVFKAITQAPVDSIRNNKVTSYQEKQSFWNKLVSGTTNKFPMGATTPTNPPGGLGVIGGHAYALLGAFAIDGFPQVVQLFNPHHKDHYKGVVPNAKKSDGSFFLTLDEYLTAYDFTFIAHVISGAKFSHKVIQKDTTMALEFTMTGDAPFSVQLEWASKRLLKGCGYLNPNFVMLVAKAGDLQSATEAVKPMMHTNARVHMSGGSGKYYVFVRGTFPTVTALQEMVVNIYGTEAPTLYESSQYANPDDLFLKMKGLCKTISVPSAGPSGAVKYTLDASTHVNGVPIWRPVSGGQNFPSYGAVVWSAQKKKVVMAPNVAKARAGRYFPGVNADQSTCADSLVQEKELIGKKKGDGKGKTNGEGESTMPLVELDPLALVTEQMEDMDVDMSLEDSESVYSAEGCRSAVARLQTLDQGETIAANGYDSVFPEVSSSIAAPGVNCGDSAIGQSVSCDKYNHWMSIKQMKTLATAFKSNLEGGCIQKAMLNGKCVIDTTLCQSKMLVSCSSGGYYLTPGTRFPGFAADFCGSCTSTPA
jgi:hypothetical protein